MRGRHQSEIRLKFEKKPVGENEEAQYEYRTYRLFGKDRTHCEIAKEDKVEVWELISSLTDIFYELYKHSQIFHQSGTRIIRSYMKRCRTVLFPNRVLRPMELLFETEEVGVEQKIAMLLYKEMGSIKELLDLKHELEEAQLLNQAKSAMLRLRAEGRIAEAVYVGIAYQAPLRSREIFQLRKNDVKKNRLILRSEYRKYHLPDETYHISRKLYRLIQSLPAENGQLFPGELSRYMHITRERCKCGVHDLRKEQIFYNLHVKGHGELEKGKNGIYD